MTQARLIPLAIVVVALVLCVSIPLSFAQELPPFINPSTGQAVPANQTACLAKLGWPKCFGWNLANDTLTEDPGFKKFEAQACTSECKSFKSSLSLDYVERICGRNPNVPSVIDLERLAVVRINSQLACAKDESGTLCLALMQDVFTKAKFNESEHTSRNGQNVVPWTVIPKDYACSKCMSEQLLIESQLADWHRTTLNTNWAGTLDRTEGGLQQRTELCKDWTAPAAANKNSEAKPATQPSSALPTVAFASATAGFVSAIAFSLFL